MNLHALLPFNTKPSACALVDERIAESAAKQTIHPLNVAIAEQIADFGMSCFQEAGLEDDLAPHLIQSSTPLDFLLDQGLNDKRTQPTMSGKAKPPSVRSDTESHGHGCRGKDLSDTPMISQNRPLPRRTLAELLRGREYAEQVNRETRWARDGELVGNEIG